MKNFLLSILLLVSVELLSPMDASGQFLAGHVWYAVVEGHTFSDDEVMAVGAKGEFTDRLDIPYNFTRSGWDYKVVAVGPQAFMNQPLKSLEFSPAMRSIGNAAFQWCVHLEEITWRRGLKFIEDAAFQGCKSLKGVLVFPESVKLIGQRAFDNCEKLEEIVLPNDLEDLRYAAFHYCHSLRRVEFNGHYLGVIPEECFYDCGELSDVRLSVNTRIISKDAFKWCVKLPSITLPRTITDIMSGAFAQCNSLKEIRCHAKCPPNVYSGAFDAQHFVNTILHVPVGSASAYRSSAGWSQFVNIKEDL